MSRHSDEPAHTIIAARLRNPQATAIRAVVQDWSAVGLVGPSIWVDVEGEVGTGLLVADGRTAVIPLVGWLARHPAPVRLAVLQVLTAPADALGVDCSRMLVQALQLGPGVPVVNLLAPVDGLTGVTAGAVFDAHVNVILQPVDGATPVAPTEPLGAESPTFPMHVACGVATATGLWLAMTESPLAGERQWTGTQAATARSYVRTLDTAHVLSTMGALLYGTDGHLPVSRTAKGDPSPVIPPAHQLAAAEQAGQSLVAKHAEVTAFRPPPAFVPPTAEQISFGRALRMFFSFLAKAVLGAPRAWAENLIESIRRRVETSATNALFGSDGRFQVSLSSGAGQLSTSDRLDQTAQSVLGRLPIGSIPPPTAVPELWQDALATASTLVDGGTGPAGVTLPRSDTPPIINDPARIAPRPGGEPFPLPGNVTGPDGVRGIEPDDPLGALRARRELGRRIQELSGPSQALARAGQLVALQECDAALADWLERKRSFTWSVSALIARQLDIAGTMLDEVLAPADQITAADLAAPLDQQRKVRRGVLAWVGLFLLLLIAVVVTAALALVAWPILLVIAVVVLGGTLFGAVKTFARNQQQLFRMIHRLEVDAERRRWLDANLAAISFEVVRLSSVYRQSRAWMAIIAENVHDPFGAATQGGADRTIPTDLQGELPLAITLTGANYSPDTHEAALYRARASLLRSGWLARQFAYRRDHVRAELSRRTDSDLGDRLWSDAAVAPGGPVDSYLAGLRDPRLRHQVYRSAIATLADAVSGPGWEGRLLPRVTVRAGAADRSATWTDLAAELINPTGLLTNNGFSSTGMMQQANLVDRSFLAVDGSQQVPGAAVPMRTRPFVDNHALDRVVIRWDMSHAVPADAYSYFVEDGFRQRHDPDRWTDQGITDVEA